MPGEMSHRGVEACDVESLADNKYQVGHRIDDQVAVAKLMLECLNRPLPLEVLLLKALIRSC